MALGWEYAGVAAIIAAGRMAVAVQRRFARRRAAAVARAGVVEVPEGAEVRLVGRVADHAAMVTSPFTGRRCAYYDARIHEGCGQTAGMVRTAVRDQSRLIILTDAGRAVVELDGARIVIEAGLRRLRVRAGDPLAAAVDAAVAASSLTHPLRPEVQVREYALEVGAEVAVVGRAVREPDPDGARDVTGYRGAAPTRLHFTGTAERPLYVSDEPAVVASAS